ncbi:hypothetical protein Calag_0926 [Caldisphaera lagunensis DSM 15908]|uniref:Glycosyltransferase RgtA/B/C/D-like domain-containing protein n=1 Tax=Caldisphaera lagunensis (strain DSM 15908 / JCM 11604 / ANMR 0165 / IC-154) TaxID=1056495 RepID=L0AC11_CALLD|nr:hypothetical protein [Caldisphaera lagunensis]AFZ70657.1 hypothetical protein Calag_0926 [Caldisphaera lagunensis DSM 15908]
MNRDKIVLISFLISSTVIGIVYAYYMFLSGNEGVYGIYDIFGPLSRFPIISILFILMESLLLIASLISTKKEGKISTLIIIYSIAIIIILRYLWPDISNYYYMTDFEDSFNHNLQATYITTNGHIQQNTFSSLQPGYWLTLAFFILEIFGKTSSITSPPFYFIIKWWTSIFVLLSLPFVFIMFRFFGLNRKETGVAIITYLILSPSFSYVVSNDYALIPFALSVAFFVRSLKTGEKNDYIMFFISFLFAIFNHQLIALWLEFGVLGVSIILLMFKRYRIKSFYLLSSFLVAYLMRIIYASGNLLQQNFIPVTNEISSGVKTLPHLYSEAIRALPAYTYAVSIKADDYISLLSISFIILLLFSLIYKKIEILIPFMFMLFSGLIAAFQVLGMGGVGWADRLPKDLLPLISFGFSLLLFYKIKDKNENNKKDKKNKSNNINYGVKILGVSLIIFVSIFSLYATWAGYSTVAFPYSEPFGEAGIGIGITSYLSPNFDFHYYIDFGPPFLNVNSSTGYYEFSWSYFIYGVYAFYPNATYDINSINYVANESNIILMTPSVYIIGKFR